MNCSEQDKTEVLKRAQEHLRVVHVEHSNYNTKLAECYLSIQEHYSIQPLSFEPPPPSSLVKSNTIPIKAHYSFDYAQQVLFPSDPMQPGPIYFLTARKCSVFGEAISRQVNLLTDVSGETGKSANAVISRVHYFFASLRHIVWGKRMFICIVITVLDKIKKMQ